MKHLVDYSGQYKKLIIFVINYPKLTKETNSEVKSEITRYIPHKIKKKDIQILVKSV